jgi:serine/threonine-protein kinase
VAHPNVCRVYDVTEIDPPTRSGQGRHCISMEYVDGEDLASLLRRIGRLPEDKALQIARQICAGLAAAHDLGIVHRDLKPANVMIDSRGTARITDFGLAGLVEEIQGAEVRAGTPAYMSPEQLGGREVSVQSDVYALGLVLYELFTGKPAFDRKGSVAELARARQETRPATPSSVLGTLDPAVERVILRCLEPDPARRPQSALAVSAALPGGDPLAAALAAGETPSPELVAAAGRGEAMRPALAAGLALVALAAFVVGTWVSGRNALRAYVPLDKPPAALVDRAQDVIAELGYTEPVYSQPADSAYGFDVWARAIDRIRRADDSARRWEALRDPFAGVVTFWYRQTPVVMYPRPTDWGTFAAGPVRRWNPFPDVTGGIMVSVGPTGRLEFFAHTPRRFTEDTEEPPEPDWSVPFELAGLDIDTFERVEPRYQRYMQLDHRAAWVGRIPGRTGEEVRIEAGANDGRVSLWGSLEPDELVHLAGEPGNLRGPSFNSILFMMLTTGGLIAGVLVARGNLRAGRADRGGTVRLAVFAFVLVILEEVLKAHGLFTFRIMTETYSIVATGLFYAAAIAMLYLAVEPHVRRTWPSMLVSWSRLLGRSASWRDAQIGRSVLWGAAAGAGLALVRPLAPALLSLVSGQPATPSPGNWTVLLGARHAVSEIVGDLGQTVVQSFFLVFLLVLGRVILRRAWPAIIVAALAWIAMGGLVQSTMAETVIEIAFALLTTIVLLTVLLRQGVLALIVCSFAAELGVMAWADDLQVWHGRPALLALGVFAALVAYGYWASTPRTRRGAYSGSPSSRAASA